MTAKKQPKTVKRYLVLSSRDDGVVCSLETKKAAEAEAKRLNEEAGRNRERNPVHPTFTDPDGSEKPQAATDVVNYYVPDAVEVGAV